MEHKSIYLDHLPLLLRLNGSVWNEEVSQNTTGGGGLLNLGPGSLGLRHVLGHRHAIIV